MISGTPTTAGTFSVTATVKDTTNASGSASFTWTINPAGGGCPSPGQKLFTGSEDSSLQTSFVIDDTAANAS